MAAVDGGEKSNIMGSKSMEQLRWRGEDREEVGVKGSWGHDPDEEEEKLVVVLGG